MKKKQLKEVNTVHLLDQDAPFAIRESFNMLRTNLMYTITEAQEGCPIYGIASTHENTGKSTVIINLAVSFTQINKRVLMIDADMRCPTVHMYFGVEKNHVGLSEAISGIEHDVVMKDILPNLDLVTSGRIPPNPAELINSPRFVELLNQWKQEYDIIFIDFPPIGIVSDAVAVCQSITGYIFAVRSGKNNAKAVKAAVESMERLGAKIVGLVLNDYNLKDANGNRYAHSMYSNYSKYNSKYSADNSDKESSKK